MNNPASPPDQHPKAVVVGSAALAVSADPGAVLVTYSLGSCVGLVLYDPEAKVGGMAHCMLPLSLLGPGKVDKPALFTDTGAVRLLSAVLRSGARKHRLVAKLAGASRLLDDGELFRIGERNHAVARTVLARNGIPLMGEACGGCESRSITLYMDSGRVTIHARGKVQTL